MKTLSLPPKRFLLVNLIILTAASILFILIACRPPVAATAPDPLVLYNFADDIPQSILDAFTAETGLPVEYQSYESTEEAVASLRAGKVYDIVVMENRFIQPLVAEKRLAEIDTHRFVNYKNVPLNFRGLVFDPQNRYSIPYSWGTTGLIVRSDLLKGPVTSWNDLWDPQYWNKVAVWRGQQREVIGLTLKSLGYSANSEDSQALAAARERLIELWGDNFVIPATSQHPREAEQFIDFLLRPDSAAQLVEQNYFQLANDAVVERLGDTLRNDPLLFPSNDQLHNAEIVLPLSPTGEALCDSVWQAFLDAEGPAPQQ